jgi:hypothetical protein
MFEDDAALAEWLSTARALLEGYFALEDPSRLEPASREQLVETVLPGGLRLRGIVDRLDVAPTGEVRVVDYKGLALDTPLPTPNGWTTMGAVAVGDQLLGADGRPCRVLVKSQVHHRPCYEVVFTDGSRIVCDNVHLWSVFVPSCSDTAYEQRVVDTDELARLVAERPTTRRGRRRLFVRASAPLELPEAELPLDPWLLGAWLGDGATRNGQLTVGHPDIDDMLRLLKEHWDGEVSVQQHSTTGSGLAVSLLRPHQDLCPYGHDSFRMVSRRGTEHRRCTREGEHRTAVRWNASVSERLSRSGVSSRKHVPDAYLRASRGQRLALLRGLMDTDGSWDGLRNRAVFVTTTYDLAIAVRDLVHGLGGTSTFSGAPYQAARGSRTAYRVDFRPRGFNPFSLPRKAIRVDEWQARSALRPGGSVRREQRRTIAAVRPVAPVATQCVQVDAKDSLYLCGQDYVPTHNTGRAPGPQFEGKALFQMKFYALVLWRTRGTVPRLLQLMYLGDREVLRYSPDEADLLAVERKVVALWEAIERATQLREFQPRPSKLCDWCDHQSLCPAFGGTPPPFPEVVPGPDALLPYQQRASDAAAARPTTAADSPA